MRRGRPAENALVIAFDLSLLPDETICHRDIHVRLGEWEQIEDSYYLMLDPAIAEESKPKSRLILGRLLQNWVASLRSLPDWGTVFLAFGFSDQCTSWLRVDRSGQRALLSVGWSCVEGWTFHPSQPEACRRELRNWRRSSSTVEADLADFIAAIKAIRAREAGS